MVIGTVVAVSAISAAPAIAVAAGAGSAATATGAGATAIATAGGTATVTGTTAAVGSIATEAFASLATPLVSAGPVGWVTLGCAEDRSWDCWKPIVRDTSTIPSKGRPLCDVISDKRIKEIRLDDNGQIFLLNIWDELFRIDYVTIDDMLAAHATRC